MHYLTRFFLKLDCHEKIKKILDKTSALSYNDCTKGLKLEVTGLGFLYNYFCEVG